MERLCGATGEDDGACRSRGPDITCIVLIDPGGVVLGPSIGKACRISLELIYWPKCARTTWHAHRVDGTKAQAVQGWLRWVLIRLRSGFVYAQGFIVTSYVCERAVRFEGIDANVGVVILKKRVFCDYPEIQLLCVVSNGVSPPALLLPVARGASLRTQQFGRSPKHSSCCRERSIPQNGSFSETVRYS